MTEQRGGGRGSRSPPKQKFGVAEPPYILMPKNTFMDVFDITCDTGDFRVHIFCPQTTQELPKKHHEAGPPKQALTTAYGCIVIVKIGKRIACAN